jgi:hypothetical protein
LRERKLLKEASSSEGGLWLPKRWVCAVKSMGSIPPIYNKNLVCPHLHPSALSKDVIESQFKFVKPPELASRLVNRYGVYGLTADLVSIDPCPICEQWVSEYNYRLSVEHKLVTALDSKSINDGEYWYYIDSRWVADWRSYLRTGQIKDRNRACSPGPIDNSELIKKLSSLASGEKQVVVKMSTDFVAVNQKVWSVFIHCHGLIGPVIERDSLDAAVASGPKNPIELQAVSQIVGDLSDESTLERIAYSNFSN